MIIQSTGNGSRRRRFWVAVAGCYLLLLSVSHVLRQTQPDPWPAPAGVSSAVLREVGGDGEVTVRYVDTRPEAPPGDPVILLIHGSPAPASRVFPQFTRALGTTRRIIVPDLPGFGLSSRHIAKYSIDFHAQYLQDLLARLGLERVHLVAYSMGGGVALHMLASQPKRFASLTLISSIGVQELELLGDYHLNHAIHGLQLAVLWSLEAFTPHMGLLDRFPINSNYARNFFDSDQRPLRDFLQGVDQPALIIHGQDDGFVPLSAAREHHRLLPQSWLEIVPGGHLVLFQRTVEIADLINRFLLDVETGKAPSRADNPGRRIDAARQSFDDVMLTAATGMQLFIYCLLIALATLVSEDLACIGAGVLAARGVIGFISATVAAFVGILIGDLLLFAAGRYIGRSALKYAPIRWFIKPEDVERASRWFEAKGPGIIFASRFLPGSRLPVYFTAGTLAGNLWSLLIFFVIAAAVWTPALVGLSFWAGERLLTVYPSVHRYALWVALGTLLGLWAMIRLTVSLFGFSGRRLLISRHKRRLH
jgi:pimeloyl-ACP methyl ester carboxylesterase/membrane protein DedA with SNARE-associated domain